MNIWTAIINGLNNLVNKDKDYKLLQERCTRLEQENRELKELVIRLQK